MRIALPSGTPAELALSPGPPLRGLVVAPDVMGLRPLFEQMCARLAADNGWAVIAVEPFAGHESLPLEERLEFSLDERRVIGDLVDAADDLKRRTDVARVAVLGFCMGGMHTFRAAGTGRFDRAVAFYGMVRPPQQWSVPGDDPLEALARPNACPTLAICGGKDRWAPPDDVEALRSVGGHVTVRMYEEADHGFVHDPDRPAHRPDDAADAWHAAIEFLA